MIRTAFLVCLGWAFGAAMAAQEGALADRVGNDGLRATDRGEFPQTHAARAGPGLLADQASIAIDPIIYDQLSRFGLRQKRVLEAIVTHPEGVDPASHEEDRRFHQTVLGQQGNHNETDGAEIPAGFTFDELKARSRGPKLASGEVDGAEGIALRSRISSR